MIYLAYFFAFFLIILGVILYKAPEGYEDENGFHYKKRD